MISLYRHFRPTRPETWLHFYKMSELVETQLNECFGKIWLPLIILTLMIVSIMSNIVAIKLHLGISITLVGVGISGAGFLFLFLLFYIPSSTVSQSTSALRLRLNETRINRQKYVMKSLLACKPLAVKSGFRVLDRVALTIMVAANIDYTVSLLLTF